MLSLLIKLHKLYFLKPMASSTIKENKTYLNKTNLSLKPEISLPPPTWRKDTPFVPNAESDLFSSQGFLTGSRTTPGPDVDTQGPTPILLRRNRKNNWWIFSEGDSSAATITAMQTNNKQWTGKRERKSYFCWNS